MRAPATVLYLYRSLQIIFNDFNNATMKFLLVLNNMIVACVVLCTYLLVRFGRSIELATTVVAITALFGCTAFLLFSYINFGKISGSSTGLISSWAKHKDYESRDDRKLMLCHLRGCPTLKVHLASFGYYNKCNTLPRVGKLIYYTAKFLLMTNRSE